MFRREFRDYPPYGRFQMVNTERLKEGMLAREFFMRFFYADCEHVCIENPVPMSIYNLPDPSQELQPYEFGDPYSKKTYLWLKGLPYLMPSFVGVGYHPFINGGGGRMNRKNYTGQTFASGGKARSKTFAHVAEAMADQWGNLK